MTHKYKLSDYQDATPYKFLTGMIESCEQTDDGYSQHDRAEFALRLFRRDNISMFAGSEFDLDDLINFLYDIGYTTYPVIRKASYFLRVYLEHEDGANSLWKIVPVSKVTRSTTYDLLDILDNPYILNDPLLADIIPRNVVNYHNRDGKLRSLLTKKWSNGEIQTLLQWAAENKKVIADSVHSYDYDSDWITLSLPPYPKSSRK